MAINIGHTFKYAIFIIYNDSDFGELAMLRPVEFERPFLTDSPSSKDLA